jgi:hypothetical protein
LTRERKRLKIKREEKKIEEREKMNKERSTKINKHNGKK